MTGIVVALMPFGGLTRDDDRYEPESPVFPGRLTPLAFDRGAART